VRAALVCFVDTNAITRHSRGKVASVPLDLVKRMVWPSLPLLDEFLAQELLDQVGEGSLVLLHVLRVDEHELARGLVEPSLVSSAGSWLLRSMSVQLRHALNRLLGLR